MGENIKTKNGIIPEVEQEHCKLYLIVQESGLVVIKQGRLKQSPASSSKKNLGINHRDETQQHMQPLTKILVINHTGNRSGRASSSWGDRDQALTSKAR